MISDEIRKLIRHRYQELGSYRKVAELFEVSHGSVRNIIQNRRKSGPDKRGPEPKLTSRDQSRIKRTVSRLSATGAQVTAARVRAECSLDKVTTRTVQRRLRATGLGQQPATNGSGSEARVKKKKRRRRRCKNEDRTTVGGSRYEVYK